MPNSVERLVKTSDVLGNARILCDERDTLLMSEIAAVERAFLGKTLRRDANVEEWVREGIAEACKTRFIPYRARYTTTTDAIANGKNWLIRVAARRAVHMSPTCDPEEFRRNYILPEYWKNAASVASEILAIRSVFHAESIGLVSVGICSHQNPSLMGVDIVASWSAWTPTSPRW